MIEKYYAAHIKTLLDAVAINVMRPKKSKNQDQTKVAWGRPLKGTLLNQETDV
jgi:hypothetical protein